MKKHLMRYFCAVLCLSLMIYFCVGCSAGENGTGNNSNSSKQVNVGDCITFGKYEQDNDTSNGKEDIEWIVLDIQNGKALVISKYILDYQTYHSPRSRETWETSNIRNWLNSTFFNLAFSSKEQSKIITTTVSADKNPNYPNMSQGNSTRDKIFLLSVLETEYYLPSDYERMCGATAYVKQKTNATSWWLRTLGDSDLAAVNVWSSGEIYLEGFRMIFWDGIRPAMWITLTP